MQFYILSCSNNNDRNLFKNEKMSALIINKNSAVRIDPFIFSAQVTRLPKGTKVVIIDRSATTQQVAKYNDYWYKIKISEGLTGWIYGTNLKILSKIKKDSIENYISSFKDEDYQKINEAISGKWWSVNNSNNFTNHCIEFYEDGKYLSYKIGQDNEKIESNFTIDFNSNEIVFLKGTSFKDNLNFIERGNTFILERKSKDSSIRFKKIIQDTKFSAGGDQK